MVKNTNSLGIIPARFASSRFPGKPLVEISGKTMIRRVYEQASKSGLAEVVVATDDERIFTHVKDFGGHAVMTSQDHTSGTDRCAEVAALPQYADFEIIVNIQGDEPFIQPSQIDLAVDVLMKNKNYPIATLAKQIEQSEAIFNPTVVKVVFGENGQALYFSRSPVPFLRNVPEAEWLVQGRFFKHIGLYAFRREALLAVAVLPPGQLERAESLEQLRWLENGYAIGIALTAFETIGIDVPEDILRVGE